jgi:hypothetical protein
MSRHPFISERLRWPSAHGRGLARNVAGRAGRGARARLYKLPYSINSFAPAMTLGGIELSAKGSIRPHSSRSLPRQASQRSTYDACRGLQEPSSICWVVVSYQYIQPQGQSPFGRLAATEFGARAESTGDGVGRT